MKVLICGSRNITNPMVLVSAIVSSDFEISEVIHGGAKGVDSLAHNFAQAQKIPITVYKPDWHQFGKAAGIIRNRQMVDECDAVIAIWDGESKGTKFMIDYAKQQNKPIFIKQLFNE